MTPCDGWRERLLAAEPGELSGDGVGALAEHLRGCGGCRAHAERILAANDTLDGLFRSDGVVDAAAIVSRARLEPRNGGVRGGDPSGSAAARGNRRLRRAGLGLALAAGVACLLFLRDGTPPHAPQQGPVAPAGYAVVEPTGDANVAVFQTDDPDITVVWLF